MSYSYREAVKEDIKNYLIDNQIKWSADTRDDVEQDLNDDLWAEDSVTGNGSGYYDDAAYDHIHGDYDAMDLVRECVSDFGIEAETIAEKFLEEDWSYWDVTIRCYLLGQEIGEAMDEIEQENPYDWNEE